MVTNGSQAPTATAAAGIFPPIGAAGTGGIGSQTVAAVAPTLSAIAQSG